MNKFSETYDKVLMEKHNKIYSFTIILIIMLLIVLSWMIFFKTSSYYNNNAIIYKEDDKYYLKIYASIADIKKITNNNKVIIDDKEYKYKVYKIKDELYINEKYQNYKEIILSGKLNKEDLLENKVLGIRINYKNDRVINYLINFMKGK